MQQSSSEMLQNTAIIELQRFFTGGCAALVQNGSHDDYKIETF